MFIGGILQSIGEITIQLIGNGESILCHLVDSGAVDSIIQQLKNWGQASEVQNKRFVLMFYAHQRAKKVVSDSPGLVDFAAGLVTSVFNLPNGQVMFF